jgi:hypothetical protein
MPNLSFNVLKQFMVFCKIISTLCESSVSLLLSRPGANIHKHFIAKAEQLLHRQFFILLMETAFGKNVPKYGAQHKSCSIK